MTDPQAASAVQFLLYCLLAGAGLGLVGALTRVRRY